MCGLYLLNYAAELETLIALLSNKSEDARREFPAIVIADPKRWTYVIYNTFDFDKHVQCSSLQNSLDISVLLGGIFGL